MTEFVDCRECKTECPRADGNHGYTFCSCFTPKKKTVTNADRINSMTIEEKADFLSSIAYGRESPWCEPFAEKFCKSCQMTTCIVEGYPHPLDLHECDFADGKCPHGGDITWWLQQPAEGNSHG